MFCPKCATQNADGASFCRSCGANVSLLPQAMTGNLQPVAQDEPDDDETCMRTGRRRSKRPSLANGVRMSFMGLGFICVAIALAYSRMGRGWWFWMLIPAFSMIGGGVAEYLRAKHAQSETRFQSGPTPTAVPRAAYANELPPRNTRDLVPPPPSVTEGTTRHLGAEAPTRVFGGQVEQQKEK